jgi:UDP-3-O-[3-hydroxymyristoyl] glucosamine N-acyltransferase
MKLPEIAKIIGGEIVVPKGLETDIEITQVAKIESAKEGEITFLSNPKYAKYLSLTKASAIIVPKNISDVPIPAILVDDAYFSFLKIFLIFNPPKEPIKAGIHKTAVIGENTKIGKNVALGAYTVIGDNCSIGDNTKILPNTVISDETEIGNDCLIYANVTLREKTKIGSRVIIHSGTVVGSDGFGFAKVDGKYTKIPQLGNVVIEDDVEIGSNCSIDRATMGETRIKRGTKLDNLVQVAHNVIIGEDTVIAAQTGIAGSTKVGNNVTIAGQVGIVGHIEIGDGAILAAQSGVSESVPPKAVYFGYPAKPHIEEKRRQVSLKQLPEIIKKIRRFEKELEELKKK